MARLTAKRELIARLSVPLELEVFLAVVQAITAAMADASLTLHITGPDVDGEGCEAAIEVWLEPTEPAG